MTEDRSHALSGLVTKRAEIAGRIVEARTALRQLLIDLDHVDAAIRIFDPDFDVDGIRPKAPAAPFAVSYRGEFVRVVLDVMREAKGPMTTKEIARHVMAGRGLNAADAVALQLFGRRTRALLYHYQERGMIRSIKANDPGRRRFNLWEIAI
jgi:hypothetical protein